MKSTLVRLGALAVVGAAALIGSHASGASGGEFDLTFTINGRVLKNGSPVSGAAVRAYAAIASSSGDLRRVLTSSNGTFAINEVPAGTYAVRASKTGFGTGTAMASVGTTTFIGGRRITIRLR